MHIGVDRFTLARPSHERLLGFTSFVIDGSFVVHGVKLVKGSAGPVVAMPSVRTTMPCPACGEPAECVVRYCPWCGSPQEVPRPGLAVDSRGRSALYRDVAHPLNEPCRRLIHEAVVAAYGEAVRRQEAAGHQGDESTGV